MKRRWLIFSFVVLIFEVLLFVRAEASGFITASGTVLLAPNGQEVHMRGISLGNWLLPEGYMFNFEKAVSSRQIREVSIELLGPVAARSASFFAITYCLAIRQARSSRRECR